MGKTMEECLKLPGSWGDGRGQWATRSQKGVLCGSSSAYNGGGSEGRAAGGSQSHSQAEKRRRARINGHLSNLRRLIPCASQLDKASLLAKVIDHVKELKRRASEAEESFTFPTEMDDVTVEVTSSFPGIRVSLCCDDRPDLLSDLIGVLRGLRLRAVRADMATVEGRVKNILVLCTKDAQESAGLSSLRDSLEMVLGRVISSNTPSSSSFYSTKRQRLFSSSSY